MNAGGVLNTCKSNGSAPLKLRPIWELASGGLVSNTWVIYLKDRDNRAKALLIPDTPPGPHDLGSKDGLYL